MFVILITISTIVLANALNPVTIREQGDDEKAKEVISKYIARIPDIEAQYVVDERLSRVISHYFKGKISSFPLYKVSVNIDRNPVKIPWTLGEQRDKEIKKIRAPKRNNKLVKKRYKFEKTVKKSTNVTTENPFPKVEKPTPIVENPLSTVKKPLSTVEKLLSTVEIIEVTTPELPVITTTPAINTTL